MSAITDPILLDSTGQDIVEALEAIAENMGTSAGHTIQNDSGTDMQRRDKLQFKGVYVEDNQANDVTKVDIVREFQSVAEIEALTGEEAKGFQYIDDDVYDAFTASDIGFDNSDTSFTGTDVQEVLEEVDSSLDTTNDRIDDVESKLTWKLVGVITTTTSQSIPTGASEILVVACNHNQGTVFGSMVVPTDGIPLVLALPYNSTDLLALNRSGTTLSFLDTTKTDRVARLYYR